MHQTALVSLAILALIPAPLLADDARTILEKARAKQVERWEGVDSYHVDQTSGGTRMALRYERVESTGPDGRPFVSFQPSATAGASGNTGLAQGQPMSPAELEQFAQAQEMVGEGLGKSIEDGLEKAGLPRGLLAASGSDPTATFDPRVMMGANAQFLRGAAQGQKTLAAQRAEDQRAAAADMADFAEQARLVGRERIDGRDAFHVRAEGLNRTQRTDDGDFTLQSVSIWLDTGEYVPLRTKIDGVATSQGETRPFTLERLDSDYRAVAGSRMFEPYRQVMRIAGVMTPQQQQEMREASEKMAEMEQQLAQMPEGQRQMVMRQMGPQMQMMKTMAAGGGLEVVTEIHQISINPASSSSLAPAQPGAILPVAGTTAVAPAAAGAAAVPSAAAAPADPDAARQAEEACLKEKMAKAQAAQKKKRGFGSLMSAANRAAGLLGNQDLAKATGDLYTASATAGDLASAARDLGISEDEIAACAGGN